MTDNAMDRALRLLKAHRELLELPWDEVTDNTFRGLLGSMDDKNGVEAVTKAAMYCLTEITPSYLKREYAGEVCLSESGGSL